MNAFSGISVVEPADDGGQQQSPTVNTVRARLLSPDLILEEDWSLRIRRLEARNDEEQYYVFHLCETALPPNGLYPVGQRLTDRPDLAGALVCAIDQYIVRSKNSKSRTQRARTVYAVITRFFEYLWINDVVHLRSATKELLADFPRALAMGGWTNVLRIRERAQKVKREALFEAMGSMDSRGSKEKLKWLLHTNCTGLVYGKKKKEIRNIDLSTPLNSDSGLRRLAVSSLVDPMISINLLYDIGQPLGFSFVPFPKPEQLASKVGRPASRTNNINISDCGALLREAMEWIYVRGPNVVSLLAELVDATIEKKKLDRKTLGKVLPHTLQISQPRQALEASLPFKIQSLDITRKSSPNSSVRTVVACLMSACFVVLASMNARRKDEILHRKYGLRRGDLKVIDPGLGLYEANFYIEKTLCARTPFYVNQVSHDAIRLLEKIEEQYHRLHIELPDSRLGETADDERSLFSYRRFSAVYGVGKHRKWYNFAAYSNESDARQFLKLALGRDRDIEIAAHMFRRMYALIFFYRYENSDLQALSHQLGHFDLQTTLIYLSDPSSRPEIESIAHAVGTPVKDRQAAHLEHVKAIDAELLKVGDEKLGEDIHRIVSGERLSGGYAKYVRRLQSKFTSSVKFETASTEDKADALYFAVKRRGHFPKPMSHGQCMVGKAINSRIARCFSNNDLKIHRENAGPETCSTCPFHLSSMAHLRLLEGEASYLRKSLIVNEPSLKASQGTRELENLERAIELMRQRLN
jgi:hypothetical protein